MPVSFEVEESIDTVSLKRQGFRRRLPCPPARSAGSMRTAPTGQRKKAASCMRQRSSTIYPERTKRPLLV